ncbi:hypothetical protein AKJ63_00255 [candidate division MSBL1 archaeon SCGC-AAA259D18]|uniref:Peptidase metallopeptidase domain-containing protein n=1 Tax=candidate division MSBL1 archaeon SCGC-AAA259D18 TaxID=1698262 RepID=A0A133UCR8_9EURY|nr:hypothetical protein AKJ63_00255 [candidate division MSBL1 archaeon SCGC-AAA259D18]
MLNMDQVGIATVTAVVAVFAVAGGAIATPVAVDSVADQQPDSRLYGLERIGEQIKGATYKGGLDWQLDRARERTEEYSQIAEEKVSGNHINLLEDAGNRMMKAVKMSEDNRGLQRVQVVLKWHEKALENVKEKVSDNANPAISLAISRSARVRIVINDIESGELPSPGKGGVPEAVKEKLNQIRENIETLQRQIRENRKDDVPPGRIVQRIEAGTAKELTNKFVEMAQKGKVQEYEAFAEEAENRLRDMAQALPDNEGLSRAREAIRKHLQILGNAREGVPENSPAAQALEGAMVRSQWQGRVLENIENRLAKRKIPPGHVKQALEDQMTVPENVIDFIENRRLPPGILKEILENREIPFGELKDFLESRRLPHGILRNLLENRGISSENFGRIPENIGPPENAGPPENVPGERGEINGVPFIHEEGKLPDWVPGTPPWAGPGEKGEGPSGEAEEEEEGASENLGYNLLDGVRIQNSPASYSINPANEQGLDEENIVVEVKEAFEAWDDQTSVELFKDEVSTSDKSSFNQDGENLVSFAPLEKPGAVAKTKIWYDETTGEILEFDMVLNSGREWGIDPDGEGPESISSYDVRNIVTHEAGHTLGLVDVNDEDYAHLTMYHQSEPGNTLKISLENWDIAGLHELYGE